MITVCHYYCEVCGAEYLKPEDALACEALPVPEPPAIEIGREYRSVHYRRSGIVIDLGIGSWPGPEHCWFVRFNRPIKDSDHGDPCWHTVEGLEAI